MKKNDGKIWANRVVIISILFILIVTLYPYSFHGLSRIDNLVITFEEIKYSRIVVLRPIIELLFPDLGYSETSSMRFWEPFINVVVFIPVGFALAYLIKRRSKRWIIVFLMVQVLCSGFSLCVEVAQVFLPSRNPSFSDLVTNSFGAFLGFFSLRLWRNRSKHYTAWFSSKTLMIGYVGYATFVFFFSIYFANASTSWALSNWNITYPLVVGNEATGNRPWRGYVSELFIADRVFSEADVASVFSQEMFADVQGQKLLASYSLDSMVVSEEGYPDLIGNLPRLVWQPAPPTRTFAHGVLLDPAHWLSTDTIPTYELRKVRHASQFTMGVSLAPTMIGQSGPARIVSISYDTRNRNFTLGQERNDLYIRLRTPISGVNGVTLQFVVPGFFMDTTQRRLIATYSPSSLKLYVDDSSNRYAVDFNPETTGIWSFVTFATGPLIVNLSKTSVTRYNIMYYGFAFIPLGILLQLTVYMLHSRPRVKLLWMLGGLVLPALFVQVILAFVQDAGLNTEDGLLAILMTGGGMALGTTVLTILDRGFRQSRVARFRSS